MALRVLLVFERPLALMPSVVASHPETVPRVNAIALVHSAALRQHDGGVAHDAYLLQTRYGNPLNRDHFREAVVRPALRAAGLSRSIEIWLSG
jgi:hypothetical protein